MLPPVSTSPDAGLPRTEREQTDDSLRVEREMADQTYRDDTEALDEAADAVIARARVRADAVLAAARAKTDRQPTTAAASAVVDRQRVREDDAVRRERASADETLREERVDHEVRLTTERQETDQDLSTERARADDALAMRDEFLGIVSHDLRNMLSAVAGYAALIVERVSQDAPVAPVLNYAGRIQRSARRMNRLVGDLVDVASIQAGVLAVTPEPSDPADVVREAVETFQGQATAAGLSLSAEIARPIALAAFDPARILQVLTNLLSNAIKFTPAGGTIVVRVETVGGDVRFAVHDTGVGIPPGQLDAVFVRFVQVTPKDRRGVGLGLYISRCIVEGHGGRIWAESTPGKGSTFRFTLPIRIGAA